MAGSIRFLMLSSLLALFAGCSDESAAPPQAAGPNVPEVGTTAALEAPVVPASPTQDGGSGGIELLAVTSAQLKTVDPPGELACTFEAPAHGTLLVARADVLPDGAVRALLNNNGYTQMLAKGQAGGFNDLLEGITLSGKGMTVRLARGANQPTGDETTRHAATLTVQRADGAERTYDGTWTCGP